MKNIRLILADDHQLFVNGLKSLISNVPDFEVIGEASEGKGIIAILQVQQADVVLMDIEMPGLNGIETTRLITEHYPETRVLVLSMYNQKIIIDKIMQAGAKGYLLKNTDYDTLILAIRKVAKGEHFFDSNITLNTLKKSLAATPASSSPTAELTPRETSILKLIAEGFSNKEISDKLFISHHTVDTHRTSLMKKLDIHNIAGLVRYAIENGLLY